MPESNQNPSEPDPLADLRERIAEEEQPRDDLPALAEERQRQAQEMAGRVIGAARALAANGMIRACGYRVLVKPLEGTMGLEKAEAEVMPELAAKGFQVKTDTELKREERGENHGIVIHMGPVAFDRMGGKAAWCDEGDVVVFSRYAGTRVEHPPGSGTFYQLMNDEDIFGKIV